jgi:hypothetical protein
VAEKRRSEVERINRLVVFYTTEKQAKALRRFAGSPPARMLSAVVREALAEYLERHAGERPPERMREWQEGQSRRTGRGKAPPRIMLHLTDRKRLKLLRLQSQALSGTHRTAGRVIRAAIDEYLEAHAQERREALRKKREKLGEELFLAWKKGIERGPAGEERPPKPRRR